MAISISAFLSNDSEVGRFGVVEPLWQDYLSISPYEYALNNPVNAKDIDGRDAKSVGALSKAINPFVALGFSNNGVKTEQGAMIVRNENHPFFKSIYLTNYAVGSENSIHTSENVGKNEQVLGRIHTHIHASLPSGKDFWTAIGRLVTGGVSFIENDKFRFAIEIIDSEKAFNIMTSVFGDDRGINAFFGRYSNFNNRIGKIKQFLNHFEGSVKFYQSNDLQKESFDEIR